jgi:exonuclease SbcC
MLGELLLELFYDQKTPHDLKAESDKGSLEVWLAGDNTRFHIRRDFIQQGNEFVRSSTLVSDEGTGQNLSVPDNLTLGEYLFRVNLRAYRQGVVVDWPKKNERDHLSLRVNNLRQGGDEGLSLIKVRASLAGAQKRVSEQKGSMVQVKTEYDALRREWEAAHRQQDEERLLLIEIRNLQENEAILSERIEVAIIIQERLALLTQNPDYRELRQLQEELTQLEDRIRAVEANLTMLTSESEVDWAVIENLRAECIEWASIQEQVERLAVLAQMRAEKIAELKGSLQTCGYERLSKDEDQRLRRAEEERDAAQEELNKLTITKEELESAQLIYSEEIARLQDFADMAGVTEADEIKIAQRERHLKQWQSSKIGCSLDRSLRKHFSGTSIGEKLASRLGLYYEGYHASNFEEFTSRLKDFRHQQKLVERVQIQIQRLQEKASREDILRRTVQTRTELLKQAFLPAKVADFPAWLNGWEDYQSKKHQLALEIDQLQLLLKQSSMEEKKLHTCAEQLREKLGDWDTHATDRDDVLAAVFKVASQLRTKDEVEREIAAYSQRFNDLLGDRNMDRLAKNLEPLADLERETMVSDDERLAELTAWQKERLETRKQRAEAEQRLQYSQKFPSLTVLEKKIETVKRQWMAYEELHSAIDDAQVLLETSWQEWQAKFGKALNNEMKWILSKISSSLAQETIQRDLAEVKRDYFAYRMAIAQLSLGSYTEAPLFFSVGDIDEGERFWIDVIEYFRKLSLTRQMILITTDPKLGEKLTGVGWSSLNMSF